MYFSDIQLIRKKIIASVSGASSSIEFPNFKPAHVSAYKGSVALPDLAICIHRHQCAKDFFEKARELGVPKLAAVRTESDKIARTDHWTAADTCHEISSYTDQESIFAAITDILASNPDAENVVLYPGYGFLSENAEFRQKLSERFADKVKFMGPPAGAMHAASNKLSFQNIAADRGLPVIEGHREDLATLGIKALITQCEGDDEFKRFTLKMGSEAFVEGDNQFTIDSSLTDAEISSLVQKLYKVGAALGNAKVTVSSEYAIFESSIKTLDDRSEETILINDLDLIGLIALSKLDDFNGEALRIKATEGGGGSGQSVVEAEDFENYLSFESFEKIQKALHKARSEGTDLFGSGQLMIQKNKRGNFRHVEAQIVSDGENIVILPPRDCSLQAGDSKKFVETVFDDALGLEIMDEMKPNIEAFLRDISYTGPGTLEFLYDPEAKDGQPFKLLEMNTRVQVEHPVSEDACGLSVTAMALHVASGGSLAELEAVNTAIIAERVANNEDVHFCGQLRLNMESHEKDKSGSWQPVGTTGQQVFSDVSFPDTIPGIYVPGACIRSGQGVPSAGDSNIARIEISVTTQDIINYLDSYHEQLGFADWPVDISVDEGDESKGQDVSKAEYVRVLEYDLRQRIAREIFNDKVQCFLLQMQIVGPSLNIVALSNAAEQVGLNHKVTTDQARKFDSIYSEKIAVSSADIIQYLINSADYPTISVDEQASEFYASLLPVAQQKLNAEVWADQVTLYFEKLGMKAPERDILVNKSRTVALVTTETPTLKPRGLMTLKQEALSEIDGHARYLLDGLDFRSLIGAEATAPIRGFKLINAEATRKPLPVLPTMEGITHIKGSEAISKSVSESVGKPVLIHSLLDILKYGGAKGFTAYIQENGTAIMSTSYRDNSQSVDANREKYSDYSDTLEPTGRLFPGLVQEIGGGARPAVDILFKDEDHFRNIEDMNVHLQSATCALFRATGISYYNQPINALKELFKYYIMAGLNMPRIFDATNNHPDAISDPNYPSLNKTVKAYVNAVQELKEEGFFETPEVPVIPMLSISYTGALASGDTVYNHEYYSSLVHQLMKTASDNGLSNNEFIIDIKDMVGQASVEDMTELVSIIRGCGFDGLIHTHMHNAQGNAAEVQAKSGADMIDAAFHREEIGIGQPPMEKVIEEGLSAGRTFVQDFDPDHVAIMSTHFQKLIDAYECMQVPKNAYAAFLGTLGARFFRIPGGQGTTYATQAMQNGYSLKTLQDGRVLGWAYTFADKIMSDTDDFSDPYKRTVLVTPTSQSAANLALMLVNQLMKKDTSSTDFIKAKGWARDVIEGAVDFREFESVAYENGYADILTEAQAQLGALVEIGDSVDELVQVIELKELELISLDKSSVEYNAKKDELDALKIKLEELRTKYIEFEKVHNSNVDEFAKIYLLTSISQQFLNTLRVGTAKLTTLIESGETRKSRKNNAVIGIRELNLDNTFLDFVRGAMGIPNPNGLPSSFQAGVMQAYGLTAPEEKPFKLENFIESLVKKGISREVLNKIHPGTLIAGYMLPENNLANLLEKIQKYGHIRVGLDAWTGHLEKGKEVTIKTPQNRTLTVKVLDFDSDINPTTKKRLVRVLVNGEVMVFPITYIPYVPTIVEAEIATFGLDGKSGFITNLESGVNFGDKVHIGQTIAHKEVMKIKTPVELAAKYFPESSPTEGYIVPVRPGLGSVMQKAKAAKPIFTQEEVLTAQFGESHAAFAIISQAKFEELFPDGYSDEQAEVVASKILKDYGKY